MQAAVHSAEQAIERAGRDIRAVDTMCAARRRDILAIRSKIRCLCVVAAQHMVDSEGYDLAYRLVEQSVLLGAPLYEAGAALRNMACGKDITPDGIPAIKGLLAKEADAWTAEGSYRICDFADKLISLEGFLDSHSTEPEGINLENVQFVFRAQGASCRLAAAENGVVRHVGGGDIGQALAANLDDSRRAHTWQRLDFLDDKARCKLPRKDLYVFYQEGPVLYAERLDREDVGQSAN